MAGGLYSRVKVWVEEVLTPDDLNAEFDNVKNNFIPTKVDDYSETVTQMRIQTDPGEIGSESQATSLAGELARLRFSIAGITGKTYHYETPVKNIASLDTEIQNLQGSGGAAPNRITSGATRTESNMPTYLKPEVSSNQVSILGSTTNLEMVIDGVSANFTADVAHTSLTLAPSTNNTALVDDTSLTGGFETKIVGEGDSTLTIDTTGSNITGEVGNYAGFKINNGVDDEYFIAYVKSSTELTNCFRGHFFNNTGAPIPRITISNNDTITLMKLNWIFGDANGSTIDSTDTKPYYGSDTPSGSSGEYWLDEGNNTWKEHDGASFVDVDRTFVGLALCDDTNCVAARAEEFFAFDKEENDFSFEVSSNDEVRALSSKMSTYVRGANVGDQNCPLAWNILNDLESGESESSDQEYYLYLTEDGETRMSTIAPQARWNWHGFYHPHHTWRAVGWAINNSSGNLSGAGQMSDLRKPNATDSGNFNILRTLTSYATFATSEIVTSGNRPVLVIFTHGPGTPLNQSRGYWRITRDGVSIYDSRVQTPSELEVVNGTTIDFPPMGKHTYEMQSAALSSWTMDFDNARFFVVEL